MEVKKSIDNISHQEAAAVSGFLAAKCVFACRLKGYKKGIKNVLIIYRTQAGGRRALGAAEKELKKF